jgi:hypothetical protein
MPTLEELFKNKQLPSQGGKTAEEAYDIVNSKDIHISAADPLVNTVGMTLARLARKNLGEKGSETLLEEELTGARIIRIASSPFIYGNELTRLTLRSTPLLEKMRESTGGNVGGGGLLGGLISKGRDFVNDKLGIPSGVIPTKVIGFDSISQKGETQNRMIDLAEIKKSGEGKLLGKFLKGTGGGNIKDIGKQALGNAIKLGKDALRGLLFGGASTTGFNGASLAGLKNTTINYGSFTQPAGNINRTPDKNGIIDVEGLMYSKTFDLKLPQKIGASGLMWGFQVTSQDGVNSMGVDTRIGLDKNKQIDPKLTDKLDFVDISDEGGLGGRYSKALKDLDTPDRILFSSNPSRAGKFFGSKEKEIAKGDFITTKKGIYPFSDIINKTKVFTGEDKITGTGDALDDFDFVPLKFYSPVQKKTVQFRATLSGMSETFSPSWESHKFTGSPFSNYTYSGIERSVSFNFKVYSLNANEHKIGWDKINFLNSLVFPQGYYGSSAVQPPFIKLTIGDLYKKQDAFIESLSHTWDDNTPWNITDEESPDLSFLVNAGLTNKQTAQNAKALDMKGYKLPFITDVSMTVKFLLSKKTTEGKKFYSFTPTT